MGVYRLYFLDPAQMILAAEVFDAKDDGDAINLAEHLADACSDQCRGYELWQLDRVVAKNVSNIGAPHLRLGEINARMQQSILEREEAIRNSRWRVSQSKKLLARIEEVRGTLRTHR